FRFSAACELRCKVQQIVNRAVRRDFREVRSRFVSAGPFRIAIVHVGHWPKHRKPEKWSQLWNGGLNMTSTRW
ncbi:hypothetical protein, partial [Sinorhizobium meliloti]|uniref:hypothetical protein n=1 Tax=Rhizobium meliloti TaxID=382 RepID=UPI001AECF80B